MLLNSWFIFSTPHISSVVFKTVQHWVNIEKEKNVAILISPQSIIKKTERNTETSMLQRKQGTNPVVRGIECWIFVLFLFIALSFYWWLLLRTLLRRTSYLILFYYPLCYNQSCLDNIMNHLNSSTLVNYLTKHD